MIQVGKLKLNDYIFKLECGKDSKFYVFDSGEKEGTITVGFDISFEANEYKNELISPSICINEHETGMNNIEEVIGNIFKVNNVEEADKREDTFYIYEHEPIEKYEFLILEIAEEKVHIQVNGIAIVDGYATPYETADFFVDCWLPIN